ncbi:spermatogenesis-associated protein 17-like isoform X1 [Ruditapes philippinarum]|uniref:spermatogenesis-associated protein 17-like isoform X1 n=1 Tax=Ruditapes philippinarum TaxID=129788 RepID=UPI00295A8336|nr:spermatogenesis-associated protein 17-like isoform X1 [Ruditapes philippinarum]
MAAMVRLLNETDAIVETSYERKNKAEIERLQEFSAAVRVQAWFRGARVRVYMKHINNCATEIQRKWRGFMGRNFFRLYVKNCVLVMKLNYFNSQATKVQKMWRGYYVRKYVFNYYSRKRYLEALVIKNDIIRNELEEYSEQQEQNRRRQNEAKEKLTQERLARKYHYLISTHVIPGVFNSPYQPYPSEMEYALASVKPLIHKKKPSTDNPYDPAWKSYGHELPKPQQLPPLHGKPQGPFREPEDVQKQRYKGFQPSLRVATSFTALEDAREKMKAEEWVTRLNDDTFLPFTRRSYQYDPLLHTKSNFGHPPYGTKYFREEFIDKHITHLVTPFETYYMPFKTVVPPIPVFEKLNDTYSQGQV